MFAAKPHDPSRPAASGWLLLSFGAALAFVDVLFYAVAELGIRVIGPNLRATAHVARYLAAHTTDPDAQAVIALLRTREVYLQSQLLAAKDILLIAHDQYVRSLWLDMGFWFFAWLLALSAVQQVREWSRERRAPQAIASPMGILYNGAFVPCPLPLPVLARLPRVPSRRERLTTCLHLRPPHPRPAVAASLALQSPLATALLEHYLACPAWPAEVVDPANADPGPACHGEALLLDHVCAVSTRALDQASTHHIPPALAEQAALGHDLGKLATFQYEDGRWVRLFRHHDRMSAMLLARIPEWQQLSPEDREDLRLAVRFHHAPGNLPPDARPRARALLQVLTLSDHAVSTREHVACPPAPAAPAPPASSPPADGPPAPTPVATSAPAPPPLSPVPAQPPSEPLPPQPDPDRCARMAQALKAILPVLRINAPTMFTGLTMPEASILMLLDPALRTALAPRLSPEDRAALQLEAAESDPPPSNSRPPIPHDSSPTLAAAFRQLGYLIESLAGTHGTLWQVKVGRRTWLACWLLRLEALPPDLVTKWLTTVPHTPKPLQPSWLDPRAAVDSPPIPPGLGEATDDRDDADDGAVEPARPDPLLASDDADPDATENFEVLHDPTPDR